MAVSGQTRGASAGAGGRSRVIVGALLAASLAATLVLAPSASAAAPKVITLLLGSGTATAPDIAVDGEGSAYIVWTEGRCR